MNYLNWSNISRELTKGHRTQVNSKYKGKMYADVVQDIKEIEKLIESRIKIFKSTKELNNLDEAIEEIELIDNLKEIVE